MPVNFKRNEALQLRKEAKRGKRREIWHTKKWIIEYQTLAFEMSFLSLHVNQMCLIGFEPCIFLCGSLQQHCTLRKDVIIFTHAYNIQCDCWRVFLFAMHADTTPKFSERTKHSLVFRLLNWNNSDIHSLFTEVFFFFFATSNLCFPSGGQPTYVRAFFKFSAVNLSPAISVGELKTK